MAEAAETRETPSQEVADLRKFNAPVLKGMTATDVAKSMRAVFLPTSMLEAMELAKVMSQSNFMPPHLRGKPGDCLGVVIQASQWGMNSYAVANKTYFVNDRMAFEAQLVNAVVNTSNAIEGRLSIQWDGKDNELVCTVTGKIKGDPEPKKVWQELKLVKTRNSPLWTSNPRQQLAYLTSRMWARLWVPEVLMGVYTPDELYEEEQRQPDGSYVAAPKRPTRDSVRDAHATAEGLDEAFRNTVKDAPRESGPSQDQAGDDQPQDEDQQQGADQQSGGQESGEQSEGGQVEDEATAAAAAQKQIDELVDVIVGEINSQGFMAGIDGVVEKYGSDIDWLKEASAKDHQRVLDAITAKRDRLKNRGKR